MKDRKQLIEAIISAMSTDDAIFHGIHIDMIRDRVYISGLPAVSEYSYDELREVVNRLILADCRRGEKSLGTIYKFMEFPLESEPVLLNESEPAFQRPENYVVKHSLKASNITTPNGRRQACLAVKNRNR